MRRGRATDCVQIPFVIAFIVALAAFMGWRLMQPACPGGAVVADVQQCSAVFDAGFCSRAIAEGLAQARRAGGSFPTLAKCLDRYPACIERSDIPAWTPKPSAYCIARDPEGEIAHVEPVYAIH